MGRMSGDHCRNRALQHAQAPTAILAVGLFRAGESLSPPRPSRSYAQVPQGRRWHGSQQFLDRAETEGVSECKHRPQTRFVTTLLELTDGSR